MQTPALYLVFDDGIVSLSVNFNRANPAREADRLLNTAEYGTEKTIAGVLLNSRLTAEVTMKIVC